MLLQGFGKRPQGLWSSNALRVLGDEHHSLLMHNYTGAAVRLTPSISCTRSCQSDSFQPEVRKPLGNGPLGRKYSGSGQEQEGLRDLQSCGQAVKSKHFSFIEVWPKQRMAVFDIPKHWHTAERNTKAGH
jgi:hypothetical protein